MRWIIEQADALRVDGQHRPLGVNLSLGVLARSKDGIGLIERQIAAEVLRHEARTGMPMRVVFAFGNENLARRTGYTAVTSKKPKDVTLRVQSEDYTPSFVELRGNPIWTTSHCEIGSSQKNTLYTARKRTCYATGITFCLVV